MVGASLASAVGGVHRRAVALDRRFEIVAACFSPDPADQQATADREGVDVDRRYDSLGDLLAAESDSIDAVAIVTPTPMHRDQVIAALEAGVPVICEKALAGSLDDTLAIAHELDERGGFLAVTYGYVGYPMVRELRARIARGDLGAVHRIEVHMPQEGFLPPNDAAAASIQAWRRVDGDVPTIALDLAVHTDQLARFVAGGQPHRVLGVERSVGGMGVVDDITMLVVDDDERVTSTWCSKAALGHRNGLSLQVLGEQAAATWHQSEPETLRIATRSRTMEYLDPGSPGLLVAGDQRYQRFKPGHPAGFIEAMANVYSDIADAIVDYRTGTFVAENRPDVAGIDAALAGMKVLDAAHRSARQSAWITVRYDHPKRHCVNDIA